MADGLGSRDGDKMGVAESQDALKRRFNLSDSTVHPRHRQRCKMETKQRRSLSGE